MLSLSKPIEVMDTTRLRFILRSCYGEGTSSGWQYL